MKTFDSMASFAEHLIVTAVAMKETEKEILTHGAKLIQKRAKEKIGQYQDQVGPFIAWPDLADSTKEDRLAQGYSEDEPLLRSGEMRETIQYSVGENEAQIGSNDDKAVYQELGTEHIPPRSFLGGAAAELVPKLKEDTGKIIVATLIGEKAVAGGLLIEG